MSSYVWWSIVVSVPVFSSARPGFESRPRRGGLRGSRWLCDYCTIKLIKLGLGWLKFRKNKKIRQILTNNRAVCSASLMMISNTMYIILYYTYPYPFVRTTSVCPFFKVCFMVVHQCLFYDT